MKFIVDDVRFTFTREPQQLTSSIILRHYGYTCESGITAYSYIGIAIPLSRL